MDRDTLAAMQQAARQGANKVTVKIEVDVAGWPGWSCTVDLELPPEAMDSDREVMAKIAIGTIRDRGGVMRAIEPGGSVFEYVPLEKVDRIRVSFPKVQGVGLS